MENVVEFLPRRIRRGCRGGHGGKTGRPKKTDRTLAIIDWKYLRDLRGFLRVLRGKKHDPLSHDLLYRLHRVRFGAMYGPLEADGVEPQKSQRIN